MKKIFACILGLLWISPFVSKGQQANVNLDYKPQKNTEGLTPFSAPLNSPEVHDDRTVTFRVKAPNAELVGCRSICMLIIYELTGCRWLTPAILMLLLRPCRPTVSWLYTVTARPGTMRKMFRMEMSPAMFIIRK